MNPAIVIIALVGFLFPIVLVLIAVVVDLLVVLWASYRWGHDRWVPGVENFLHRHIGAPIGRFAHSHHLLPRSH